MKLFLCTALFWIIPGRLDLFDGKSNFITLINLEILLILFLLFWIVPLKKSFTKKTYLSLLLLIGLAISNFILGSLWYTEGLTASYYANTNWNGTPEASWTHQNLMGNATRIDKQINFSDKGFSPFEQTFPLYFANDVYRFNWAADDSQREKRRHFPFSAEWNGFIEVLKEDPKKGVLLAKGGHAEIEINGFKASVLNSEPLYFQLKPGIHKIQIRYARQGNGVRRLTLGWENELGKVEAIPSSRLSPTKGSLWHNRLLQNINFILYFFYIATLKIVIRGNLVLFPIKRQIGLEKRLIALFFILFIIIIFSYAVSKGNQPDAQILSGGNDWLLYETQARNILMGDILDVKSTAGNIYHMNVFYRYLLAGFHLIFGEGVTMIIVGQQVIMFFLIYFLDR